MTARKPSNFNPCQELKLIRLINDQGQSVQNVSDIMFMTNEGSVFAATAAMLRIVRELKAKGITVHFVNEACAVAKAKGAVYLGRKPALNAEQVADLEAKAATGAKKTAITKEFGIKGETLYQYLRQAA